MRFIAALVSRHKMKELLERYKKIYGNLDKDAAELLKACVHMDIHIDKSGEAVDMCKAWDDLRRIMIVIKYTVHGKFPKWPYHNLYR